MTYETIRVRRQEAVYFIQISRPAANNTINDVLTAEFRHALRECEEAASVVVVEGLPEVFCFGADFQDIHEQMTAADTALGDAEALYDLWLHLTSGPFISVAYVRGKANAGGIGFVTACDIALADETALFSLSEMLFGLYPACVLPFLTRRVGFQRAHYMTLTTQPVTVRQAVEWGLIDACDGDGQALRKLLLRLRRISKPAIVRYKRYMNELYASLGQFRQTALTGNREIFSDYGNLQAISRFAATGQFPWEAD